MTRRYLTGQSTAEYVVVLGLVIAAVVAMQVYVKRSVQAQVKDTTDYLGTQASDLTGNTGQYEPYYASSNYTTSQTTDSIEAMSIGGQVNRTNIGEETKRTAGGFTKTDKAQ